MAMRNSLNQLIDTANFIELNFKKPVHFKWISSVLADCINTFNTWTLGDQRIINPAKMVYLDTK